jgi:hypothetical protein
MRPSQTHGRHPLLILDLPLALLALLIAAA